MSTKTTFKRIALVAVAALGMGVLTSVAPANAADIGSFSIRNTKITVVDNDGTATVAFVVTTKDIDATARALVAGETLTVTTTTPPKQVNSTTNASAITWELKQGNLTTANAGGGTNAAIGGTDTAPAANNPFDSTDTTADGLGVYYFVGTIPADARGAGYYTLRFQLENSSGVVQRSSAQVRLVESVADLTDAAITVTSRVASAEAGSNVGGSYAKLVTVKATADSGLIVSGGLTTIAPTLRFYNVAGDAYTAISGLVDNGTTGVTTAGADATASDGTFNVPATATPTSSGYIGDSTIVGTFIGSGISGSTTLKLYSAPASGTVASIVHTASGKIAGADADNWTLPLTTKTASVTVRMTDGTTPLTGKPVYFSVAYTGTYVTADMSPLANKVTSVLTDAAGYATYTVTNANPLDTAVATISISGFSSAVNNQVFTWAKAAPKTAISNPGGNVKVALKSVNATSWTILDQFGAPVVGQTVQFTHSGINAPTTGVASAVTDANGAVSYSFTDALGAAADADTVSIKQVGTVTAASVTTLAGSVKYTYATTVPVVASFDAFYGAGNAASTASTVVPTTLIGGSSGRSITANSGIDTTKTISTTATAEQVGFLIVAKDSAGAVVGGVPVTVTVDNASLISAAGKLATSRTFYPSSTTGDLSFVVVGTKTGTATVTVTAGAVTTTAKINFVNVKEDARVLSVSKSSTTAVAGALELPSYTLKVVDRFGNAVPGVGVDVELTGTGRLANGSKYASYTTNSTGEIVFEANSSVAGTATITAKVTTSGTHVSDLAGYNDATASVAINDAVAGVKSVTATTVFAEADTTAAQTAADAAAEATDAANAATDAANAAAEAADAATAAAQDAADAVAALSTQVTEMVSALKKQITALTNLVIKIQKKVKA